MDLQQTLLPQLNVNISAKLITSLKILQLSSEELSQTIQQELTENPALEIDEQQICPICGSLMLEGGCPNCFSESRPTAASQDQYDAGSYIEGERRNNNRDSDDDYDPVSLVASDISLADYLTAAIRAVLDEADFDIADYLIGSLDEFGYLTARDEEVAAILGVEVERVTRVVEVLQRQDPVGVGARTAQECLLIQLTQLEAEGKRDEFARRILVEHFEELGEHKFEQIAAEIRTKVEQVLDSWAFIKDNLTPFPAWSYWRDGQRITADRAGYVRPDVAIVQTEEGFAVEVLEAERYQLRISEFFPRLIQDGQDLSANDREFVRRCASRAKFFIDCIQQRWSTLRQISECLVECQQEFFEHGVRHLKPLTRSEIAFRVGLHESTVSRATANKFILLPSKRVISFDDLFDGSLGTKDAIREIIEREDHVRPLSDQDISQRLQENGIFLARRTVAKYREAMRILPSNLRTRMELRHSHPVS